MIYKIQPNYPMQHKSDGLITIVFFVPEETEKDTLYCECANRNEADGCLESLYSITTWN